jgi:PAS domain S-box-containing protein
MKSGENGFYSLHPGAPEDDPKPLGKGAPAEVSLVDAGSIGVSTTKRTATGRHAGERPPGGRRRLDKASAGIVAGQGEREESGKPSDELMTFADAIPDGVFRLDRKLRHVFVNNAMAGIFRSGGEGRPGSLDDWGFLSGEVKGRVKKSARKAFASSLPQEVELTCDGEGDRSYFSLRFVPETGRAGDVGTILGIMRDITSLKRNEAEIETEHSFREAIGRSLSIGICAIDDHGKQIYVNPAFCRIVGWTGEELLGSRFPYVYWPEDELRKARRIFLNIRRGGRAFGSFEVSLQRRDGSRFDALVMYSAFHDNSGKRIGWIGSVGDISGLKRKEKELQRLNKDLDAIVRKRTDSLRVQNRNLRDILMGLNKAQEELRLSETRVLLEKQRLETILNVVPAGVIVVEGREGRIAYANRRARDLFGGETPSDLDEVGDLARLELLRPDGKVCPYEEIPLNRSLFQGETVKGEQMALMRPDGQVIPILVNTTPFVAGGEIVGAVGSFVDITRMKMSEESIRTLNAELAKNLVLVEDTNKELEGFVHSVTHDLRSPLVVINGFSRRLLDLNAEEFGEKSHDYVEYIRETSQNALFLVRDLLRLFKIAGGEMNRTTVDLAEMSRSLRQYFGGLYPRRSLRLIVPDTLLVTGDYSLLKIVMENLLDNSYKFTARNDGEAVVEIGSRRVNEDLVVFVRDNGCGFDAARAGRIFEPFSRFHKETDYRGNGIGLATVKRIVHRHGGRIWAESRPGRGATFCFTLPD